LHQIEIKVLLCALKKIQSEKNWSSQSTFGESCDANDEIFTLGCALEIAQLEVRGEIKNRSKEMGVIRRLIYYHFFWRAGIHPVTYFNSNTRTKHEDVVSILQRAIDKLK